MTGADGLRVIDGGAEDAPIVRRPRDRRCSHRKFEVSETNRRVYCSDCDEEVDAIDVLLFLAKHRERYVHAAKSARAEARRVEARLTELKRDERNTRARLARLSSTTKEQGDGE